MVKWLAMIIGFSSFLNGSFHLKVAELEDTLEKLTSQYTVAVEAKVKCQQEADATGATISLANRLVGGNRYIIQLFGAF